MPTKLARELYDIRDKINPSRVFEDWHDALQIREEALERFSLGLLDLTTRARIEKLFGASPRRQRYDPLHEASAGRAAQGGTDASREVFLQFLAVPVVAGFVGDRPDVPHHPIARLDEKPTRNATLQDVTCDSDGKISNFVSPQGASHSLPVHTVKHGEHYYIGVFLVGAYQEILGDLHNLFGDTAAVHISLTKDGYEIEQVVDGEPVADAPNMWNTVLRSSCATLRHGCRLR